MIEDYEKTTARTEHPPYPCKMCEMYEVEFPHDTCRV